MRQPRIKNEKHLDFVRSLPCVVCGDNTSTEAAHVRYGERRAGKRNVGMGEKPDDAWAVPLCGKHHRMQHAIAEDLFWHSADIDPVFVALALYRASGNHELGTQIVNEWRS